MENKEIKCQICGKIYYHYNNLASHIKKCHSNEITLEQYYIKYINQNNDILCPFCKKQNKKFYNIKRGYEQTCCNKSCIIKCREQTYFLKTGYNNPSQNPDIKQQKINTTLLHYNVENPFQIEYVKNHSKTIEAKQKRIKTFKETIKNRTSEQRKNISKILSDAHNNRSDDAKRISNEKRSASLRKRTPEQIAESVQKGKNTKQKKYNDPNWNNRPKNEKTCITKYGIKNGGGTPQAIEKGKNTKQKKYGNPTYVNNELAKQTNLNRYGVITPLLLCKNIGKISKLNKRIYMILNKYYIYFNSEFQIKYDEYHSYFYDIKFNNNVLLEINGDRVHANPEIFKDPNEIIRMQSHSFKVKDKWEKDQNKKEIAEKYGYKVIYLWENKMKKMKDDEIFNWIKLNCLN